MWSLLRVSGTTWSSEAIFTPSVLGSLLMSLIRKIFFRFNRRIWKGWRLVLLCSNPEDWLQVPQSLPCIQDRRLWKWCGLQYRWSLVDTCISNRLLIGPMFSGSFASLALGRGGNELVAAQCRAGDNNEDCSGRMGGTFCLPQLVWYTSYTIIWPKGFLSVWRRGIEPYEISYVSQLLAFRQVCIRESLDFLSRKYRHKVKMKGGKEVCSGSIHILGIF